MVDRDIEDFDETPRREGNDEGPIDDELQSTVRELWKTGLEVFIHQLLYRRGIYPRDTFCSTRFVGVECKINNNPGVLQYVSDALKETVPFIFHKHGSDCRLQEILVEIYDQATEITHEEFSLSFSPTEQGTKTGFQSSFRNNSLPCSDEVSEYVIGQVERDLRDLVRSTGKLERPSSLVWDESVSFKIVLGFHDPKEEHNEKLTPTQSGLNASKWTESRTVGSNCRPGNRVLFDLPNFECQFQYRLMSSKKKGHKITKHSTRV